MTVDFSSAPTPIPPDELQIQVSQNVIEYFSRDTIPNLVRAAHAAADIFDIAGQSGALKEVSDWDALAGSVARILKHLATQADAAIYHEIPGFTDDGSVGDGYMARLFYEAAARCLQRLKETKAAHAEPAPPGDSDTGGGDETEAE
jgi:hypothetical protein